MEKKILVVAVAAFAVGVAVPAAAQVTVSVDEATAVTLCQEALDVRTEPERVIGHNGEWIMYWALPRGYAGEWVCVVGADASVWFDVVEWG